MYITYYIGAYPLIRNTNTLQVFETIPTVSEGYLYDFKDGSIYQDHPLFCSDDHALQLVIYYDDVEPANPLGSYHGSHKLGTKIRALLLIFMLHACMQDFFTTFSGILTPN